MHFETTLKCHLNHLNEIPEDDSIFQNGCISICDEHQVEQMIFLGKAYKGSYYEVRIYKANPEDTYVPHHMDFKIKKFKSNDKFDSFFFDRFFFARRFVFLLKDSHPEYAIRPSHKSKR